MTLRRPVDLRNLLIANADQIEAVVQRHVDDEMDRDDLRQEIAIAVWQAMPRFLGQSSERTYVIRIAQNRAVSFRVRLARRRALFQPLETDPATPDRDSGEYRIADLQRQLGLAMLQLSHSQHELLSLVAEGYTPRQIALRTGRSSGAVRIALHRARAAVRRWITQARSAPEAKP